MTRKQALEAAIRHLSEAGRNEEADILHTIMEELPLNRWTDGAIRDSVEQFILDHSRVPTVSDFKKRGLPPHTVIRQKYGITLRSWLDRNFPDRLKMKERSRTEATEAFVRDYLCLKPKSAEEYNRRRKQGSPCWYTVATYNGVRSWHSLLNKLELPVFSGAEMLREKEVFRVTIRLDEDLTRGIPAKPQASSLESNN